MKVTSSDSPAFQSPAARSDRQDGQSFATALMTELLNRPSTGGNTTAKPEKLPPIGKGHSVLALVVNQLQPGAAPSGMIGTSADSDGVDLSSLDVDAAADAVVNAIGTNGNISLEDVRKCTASVSGQMRKDHGT